MEYSKITVDVEEAVEEFKEELQSVNSERDDVLEQANEYEEPNVPRHLEDRWTDLESQRVQLERRISRFETFCDAVSTTEFVIQELTLGQVQAVKDIVSQESFDVDVQRQSVEGSPLQGVYQAEFLKRSVVQKPPEVNDVMDLPDTIGEWLWEKVDAFNTSGDEDMGNMSLTEAMNSED